MTRFNSTAVGRNTTTNHEGYKAYKMGSEMELYTLVCTCALSNKFYESADTRLDRLRSLVKEVDPLFVARLAVYAREKMYLRTIPLVLTVELAKIHSGDSLVSSLVERVIQRADEITELLAYYTLANDRKGAKVLNKVSNQVKKGIGKAFNKFNEYQFAKYNRKSEIRLKDALFISHAKPENEENKILFKKIAEDTLETPYTWEVQLSEAGQKGLETRLIWEELIDSKKVGYMALLRNLRNILEAGVSKAHVQAVCTFLSSPLMVERSRQFPFRFLSAYRMLSGDDPGSRWDSYPNTKPTPKSPYVPMVLNALETAVKSSINNIPMFRDETVLIASDVSSSMWDRLSERSIVRQYDIGLLMGMLLNTKCEAVTTGIFGDTWKPKNLPTDQVLTNLSKLYKNEGEVGYSTNGYKVLQWANKQKVSYDRIMMFTDGQMYGGSITNEWTKYKKSNPNAKLYLFDLSGYGNTPLDISKGNDVFLIAGWSDEVFKVMSNLEKGAEALDNIKEIVI